MEPPLQSQIDQLEKENRRLRERLRAAGFQTDEAVSSVAADAGATVEPTAPVIQQQFASQLLDSMSEGIYVVDRAGRTTLCNTAMVRLLGFDTSDELLGRSLHEIIHHSHADGTPYPVEACPIYRAAREGISMVVADEVFYRRDGTAFPVEYRTEPLIHDGALLGAICTFVDISARMEGDRKLKDSQERLALAAAAGGIGVWDYEVETRTLRWDDRVRELFGMSAGTPITLEGNMAALHPDDRTRVEQAFAAAMDPLGHRAYQVRFRAIGIEDRRQRWVEAQGKATFTAGKPVRLLGVARDISREMEAERHLRLMVNELNHRVKNSLAMVQGLAAQTFRNTDKMDAARDSFTERLVALARAHDVLTATNWEGADLRHVVNLTVQSHSGEETNRFDVVGDDVVLSPKAALAFSLALHELATNAVKYGALSNAAGRVAIRWTAVVDAEAHRLQFTWREAGGPVVAHPRHRGFGSKLIERGLASELQGTVRIEFHADGVVCSIDAPYPSAAHGFLQ